MRENKMLNKLIQSTEADISKFKKELTSLLNRYGYDTACETPDHILADYIGMCLENYCVTMQLNIAWHTDWKRLAQAKEILRKYIDECPKKYSFEDIEDMAEQFLKEVDE